MQRAGDPQAPLLGGVGGGFDMQNANQYKKYFSAFFLKAGTSFIHNP